MTQMMKMIMINQNLTMIMMNPMNNSLKAKKFISPTKNPDSVC